MGLDITAYKNLKKVKNPRLDEDGYPENYDTEWKPGASMEWSEKYFKGRGEGIEPQSVYTWEDKIGFRAGSYSGYGWWRSKLNDFSKTIYDSVKAEVDKNGNVGLVIGTKDVPFIELINFADNEGVIAYVVAKKLYKDFQDNKNKAEEFSKTFDDGNYWLEKYEAWEEAFEYASQNGAVDFH